MQRSKAVAEVRTNADKLIADRFDQITILLKPALKPPLLSICSDTKAGLSFCLFFEQPRLAEINKKERQSREALPCDPGVLPKDLLQLILIQLSGQSHGNSYAHALIVPQF